MKKVLPWIVAGVSVLTTACACIENDGYDHQSGWRRAKVLEIGAVKTVMRTVDKDCRLELGMGAPFDRYAVASYSLGGRSSLRAKQVVAIPNNLELAVGEWVQVNVRDCTKPLYRIETKKE